MLFNAIRIGVREERIERLRIGGDRKMNGARSVAVGASGAAGARARRTSATQRREREAA